jgi:large conductance mechanosensitive channel
LGESKRPDDRSTRRRAGSKPAARGSIDYHGEATQRCNVHGRAPAVSLISIVSDFKRRKPRMSMIQEFKNFALKGNVMDLAVGVIIGGAFSTIVNSVVKDLIMPVVGLATGGLDFSNLFVRLGHIPPTFKGNPDSYKDLQTAGVAVFGYGSFITVLINFIILAFIIFMMVRFINNLRKPEQTAPAATPEDVLLLREIRDELKKSPRV